MPQVILVKAAKYPPGSSVVHRSGTVLDVTEEEAEALLARGQINAEVSSPGHLDDETDDDSSGEEEQPLVEGAVASGVGSMPLPKKAAPVSEWKEYARVNGIKLTGLTKRNEIIGFILKVAESNK